VKRSSRLVATALVLATASVCGPAPAATGLTSTGQRVAALPAARVQATQTLTVGGSAWVSVSVARLWLSPKAPWQVDAPALTAPVRFRTWLRRMTLSQRRDLDLRSDTEALLGDKVVVTRLRRHWAKVVVPSQPSPKNSRGYPGWVPRRQLTAKAPIRTTQVATVVSRTSWLRTDDSTASRVIKISFGSRLPVLGQVPGYVRVVTPLGKVRRLAASAAVVHARGTPALLAGQSSLVSTAKKFLGLPYLWGGLSGFGLDCSGLTWLDYRVHGIRIPRDALPQSQHGTAVSTRAPGDLLFYANDGRVHHVTMYIGDGQIIQAPRTGRTVEVIGFSDPPLRSEYVGARRYLP
jgi:cell wall-associated NlpC family hydrolase